MKVPPGAAAPHRVIYCLRRFPVLSETFILREIQALRRRGVVVVIVAEEADPLESFDDSVRSLARAVRYGPRWGMVGYLACAIAWLWRDPRGVKRVASRLRRETYSRFKSSREDVRLFGRIVYLAHVASHLGITHVHAPWAAINAYVAMRAAELCEASFTVQVRAFELYSPRDRYLLVEKLGSARFVFTNTEYNRRALRALDGVPSDLPIHRVYNGIDLDRFDPPARRPISAERTCEILCVARLVEQKGIEHLMQACRYLLDDGRDVHCTVVGGPFPSRYAAYDAELRRLASSLELEGRFKFSGPKTFEDVLDDFRRADLFVLPCVIEKEGNRDVIPNVIIEAMALELPVIASDLVGIPEMIDHGVNGLLVPPADPRAIAAAVEQLIRDPQLALHLGRRARQRVKERFDIDRNVGEIADRFAEL